MSVDACASCGAALRPGAPFCSECGARQAVGTPQPASQSAVATVAFDPSTSSPAPARVRGGAPPKPLIGALAVLLLVIVGGGAFYFLRGRSDGDSPAPGRVSVRLQRPPQQTLERLATRPVSQHILQARDYLNSAKPRRVTALQPGEQAAGPLGKTDMQVEPQGGRQSKSWDVWYLVFADATAARRYFEQGGSDGFVQEKATTPEIDLQTRCLSGAAVEGGVTVCRVLADFVVISGRSTGAAGTREGTEADAISIATFGYFNLKDSDLPDP